MKQKIRSINLRIVLVLLLVLAMVAAVFMFNRNTNPILQHSFKLSNGYSIFYPDGFTAEDLGSSTASADQIGVHISNSNSDAVTFVVTAFPNDPTFDYNAFINGYFDNYADQIAQKDSLTLSGIPGYRVAFKPDQSVGQIVQYILNTDKSMVVLDLRTSDTSSTTMNILQAMAVSMKTQ